MGPIAKLLLGLAVIAAIIFAIWHFNRNNSKTVGDHVGEAIDTVPAVAVDAVQEVRDSDTLSSLGASTEEALENTGAAASSALSKAGKSTSSAVSKATDGRDETR